MDAFFSDRLNLLESVGPPDEVRRRALPGIKGAERLVSPHRAVGPTKSALVDMPWGSTAMEWHSPRSATNRELTNLALARGLVQAFNPLVRIAD